MYSCGRPCIAVEGYAWLWRVIYSCEGHVWLCRVMYSCEGLCIAVEGHV